MIRALALMSMLLPAGVAAQERLITDRPVRVTLAMPVEDDAFQFAIVGDRTSGPPEGVLVLAQAVGELNLLGPDLVMTVGDLIQGYTRTDAWLKQMREYRDTMAPLRMPWFPVAGNHDTYWGNTPNRPRNEHDDHYEQYFGPLWYAFPHKGCWFVVLYSDEGDPETGKKSFQAGPGQQMTDAQFRWLTATLEKTKDARHVFVFLHHPRWIEARYGETWRPVHNLLAKAGNVSAVFAGHIHRQFYDGPIDGIEYFTLATTGGSLDRRLPMAGFLHQFLLVTVRDGRTSVASIPVGSVADPRTLTQALTQTLAQLHAEPRARVRAPLMLDARMEASGSIEVEVENPTDRPLEVQVTPQDVKDTFAFAPDHIHQRVAAGAKGVFTFQVGRSAHPRDPWFDLPALRIERDYLTDTTRYRLPDVVIDVPVRATALPESTPGAIGVLHLERDACLRIEDDALALPDGPFTVETWVQAGDYKGRRGLLNKTQSSDFGLFVSDGKPAFLVHVGGAYASAAAKAPCLRAGAWHHVAGVFDGSEVRLYVDGSLRGRAPAKGARTRRGLPMLAGADPRGDGTPESFLKGRLHDIRLSTAVRYLADFEPELHPEVDADTHLLWRCNADVGMWVRDESGHDRHALRVGPALCR